jgi:hypothetical protein
METQTQRVVLETSTRRIVGDLTLPVEGYRTRVSDLLNRRDLAFLAVTDATLEELDDSGSKPASLDFVAIGIGQLEIVYPAPAEA